MTFKELIFADTSSVRMLRHSLFWLSFGLYFYLQSIGPRKYEDLFLGRTYYYALISWCCFLPVFVLTVYLFKSYLVPLVKDGRIITSLIFFIIVYIAGTAFNYFTASLLLAKVHYSIPVPNDFRHRLEFANYNTRWALILGNVVMGIDLARSWYIKTQENLTMLHANATAKTRIQKSRIHPLWLFRALDKVRGCLDKKSGGSAPMILNLSDLLSYSLYESDAELVELETELTALQHLVSVERADCSEASEIQLSITGETGNLMLTPMSVINKVVAQINLRKPAQTVFGMKIEIIVEDMMLLLQTVTESGGRRQISEIDFPLVDSSRKALKQ